MSWLTIPARRLCVEATEPLERGRLGWMQAGVLRALMGGGALVLAPRLGDSTTRPDLESSFSVVFSALAKAPKERRTFLGRRHRFLRRLAYKGLEVVLGPLLLDRGYTQREIGWFTAAPMIAATIVGALLGAMRHRPAMRHH